MEDQNNQEGVNKTINAPKFAFFYLLSLVALIFMAVSSGMAIFQIINKYIPDLINNNSGRFNDEAIKFAISSLIISTPIFYIISKIIYKSLFSGELGKDSGVRRWLTYLILLVSSVVMIGWAIAIINNFLDGELTMKFALKSLTALIIAAAIFSFYLYDIKRKEVVSRKDKVIKIYFFASLVVVIAVFISALFVFESPKETRNRKMDGEIIRSFQAIDNCVNRYSANKEGLSENLDEIIDACDYTIEQIANKQIKDGQIEYKKITDEKYELCAYFNSSNRDDPEELRRYPGSELKSNLHDIGWQCLERKINKTDKDGGAIELERPF